MNGGFQPAKLPKKMLAPIHLKIEGTIGMADDSNPPPLRELILEIDRNGALDTQGLPACKLKRIKGATTSQALKACRPALVGEGKTSVEVAYPEQSSLLPWSTLLAFNGGVKDGKPTVYIHSYLVAPVSAPTVMTAQVSKTHVGPYGTKLVTTIPPIAKGFGFIKKFQLTFFRSFTYKRKKQSFVKARCFDGRLQVHWEAVFGDGTDAPGVFKRPCTPQP